MVIWHFEPGWNDCSGYMCNNSKTKTRTGCRGFSIFQIFFTPRGIKSLQRIKYVQVAPRAAEFEFTLLFYPLCAVHVYPSKTAWKHDVTTTMVDGGYSVLRFESLTFTPPNMSLWPNSSICVSLTIKYSSRRYLARPCWQSHISLVLEGVDFFTRRFFLVSVILNISTNFLFPEGKSSGFLPDLGKVVTRLNNYVNNYDSLNRWSWRLKLFRNASERPAQLV